MDEQTLKELGTRYDLDRLRARLPRTGVSISGLAPERLELDGWRVSLAETLRGTQNVIRRAVFDAEDVRQRVLVDIEECPSPPAALDALLVRLAGNQLARLDEGPEGLGFVSFQHPPGVPAAVFFAHDNLCVAVVSFGSRAASLVPWLKLLTQALSATTGSTRR